MRPIPLKLRAKMSENPFMSKCAYPDCYANPEFEHCFLYGKSQINTEWAIIPICTYHHRGAGLNKKFNRWVSIMRTDINDYRDFPKVNWIQLKKSLNDDFKHKYDINLILKPDLYKNEN